MSSEEKEESAAELTEDALARRVYHLDTLHELNEGISTLKTVREVIEESLLYIRGVFGLRSGLITLYRNDETRPVEFVYRGIRKTTTTRWSKDLEAHLKEPYIRAECVVQNDTNSPLAKLLKKYRFRAWLPLQADEHTWGGIALGEKLSEMAFTEDDLGLLSTIAISIQNVLSNVSLIEALHQAFTKETRIRNIFQRYAPVPVVNEVLDPSNEELLLGESEAVRHMVDDMIAGWEEQNRLEQDLNMAHEVQQHLLPSEAPQMAGLDLAARSIPARGVCGDLYDFIPLNPHEIGISLADIAGKGMSAAMIAVMLQSTTRMCVGSYYPIPAVLSILNRFMFRHTEASRYATMFYGQMDIRERVLTYSNAGHPPAILWRDGKLQFLDTDGHPVGIFEESNYYQDTIKLQSDDALIIYSDGVTDAGTTPESADLEECFGQERLEAVIMANASLSADAILNAISDEVTRYAGDGKQFDDITLIVMKVE